MNIKNFLITFLLLMNSHGAFAGYTLVCNPGGLMSQHWSQQNWPSRGMMYFTFFRTRHGSDDRTPGEGECAWRDRPVRHNEPYRVCVYDVGVRSYVVELKGKMLATSYDTSEDKKILLSGDLFKNSGTFAIQVINRNGCLEYLRRGT